MTAETPEALVGIFALSEQNLFSLYIQYPDLNTFLDDDSSNDEETKKGFSSPISNRGENDENDASQISQSTTCTTPLRQGILTDSSDIAYDYHKFIQLIHKTDLPQPTREYFASSGYQFVSLSNKLRDLARKMIDPTEVNAMLEDSGKLVNRFQESKDRCSEQMNSISNLKTLIAFNVKPGDGKLWSTYRQRALLVMNNTVQPCLSERRLLRILSQLFDAYVYHPYLQLSYRLTIPDRLDEVLNMLYDSVMGLSETYNEWYRMMKTLKTDFIVPLMDRILSSSRVLQQIEEMESIKARVMALSPRGSPENSMRNE